MYKYIYKDSLGYYLELVDDLRLNDKFLTGTTYEDFNKGAFILMSDEQIEFHNEYPFATVEAVINLDVELAKAQTLEGLKKAMKETIDLYDVSSDVNGFTINDMLTTWFTPAERANYSRSVESAKLLGVEKLQFFVGDVLLEVSTSQAELMLAAIQLYADQCYIVTRQHKLNVDKLQTIEEVTNYDYKSDYPAKLNFDIAV